MPTDKFEVPGFVPDSFPLELKGRLSVCQVELDIKFVIREFPIGDDSHPASAAAKSDNVNHFHSGYRARDRVVCGKSGIATTFRWHERTSLRFY